MTLGQFPRHLQGTLGAAMVLQFLQQGEQSVGRFVENAVRCSAAICCSRSRRSRPFAGKKPSKQKRPLGRPLLTSAVVAAQGPGMQITSCPAVRAAAASSSPGSLIPGKPASLITARLLPAASNSRNWGRRVRVLCWWKEIFDPWSSCSATARCGGCLRRR